jgi:hypothetical protein
MTIKQGSGGVGAFETALEEQQQRFVAVLAETDSLAASPIVADDERLDAGDYVTLVYELHHVQLPELEAAGLVVVDRQDDEVTRGPRFEEHQSFCNDGGEHRIDALELSEEV